MSTAITVPDVAKRAYGTGRLYTKHDAWYGAWRTPAGRRNRRIGPIRKGRGPGLTKTEAEARLREMIIESANQPTVRDTDPTVAELGIRLVARLERDGRKPSHIETARGHVRKHINARLGDLRVTEVTSNDVQTLVDGMLARGLAAKTVRNVVGTLHSLMQLAVKDRLIDRNPCEFTELPPAPRSKEIRFLTADELERVLAAEPGTDDEIRDSFPTGAKYGGPQAVRDWWSTVRLLILTAAMTGMRLGELRALRWSDLDWGAVKVRVRQSYVRGQYGSPKSRTSSRGIPTASRLVEELDAHHRSTAWNQDSDLVLAHPHTGRPLDRVRLLIHFHAALKRADVRPVRLHDLRHTFATTVAASGAVSLRTLQEWMGHEDLRTTQLYADYMPGGQDQQLLDEAFGATGAKRVPTRDNTTQQGTP